MASEGSEDLSIFTNYSTLLNNTEVEGIMIQGVPKKTEFY